MKKDFIDILGKEDDRPKKGGWAPGGYSGTCSTCGVRFLGDKRAGQCADCAYKEEDRVLVGTPSAKWREQGKGDPHGKKYNIERALLSGGNMTDDQLANELFLEPSIYNLTAAKERIRWLSRKLEELNNNQE